MTINNTKKRENENKELILAPLIELVVLGNSVNDEIVEMLKSYTEPEFQEIVLHQVSVGGKRLRSAFTLIFYNFFGGSEPNIKYGAAAVELLHNYTLIIDDIIDSGTIRRGDPTTRVIYGDKLALLSALIYREAVIGACKRTKKFRQLTDIIDNSVKDVVDGERLDILFEQVKPEIEYYQKYPYRKISIANYWDMIRKKTGKLFGGACQAGVLLSDNDDTEYWQTLAYEFGELIGIAFQIMDDILDLKGDKAFGKEIGKDLIEHKLGNLPLLHVINNYPNVSDHLMNLLTTPSLSAYDLMSAIDIIDRYGGFAFALRKAKEVVIKAENILQKFPDNNQKEFLLTVARVVIERDY